MECARLLPAHLLLLLLFHLVARVLPAAAADAPVPVRPGCAMRCGDINVPYPFGLDPQCAIHSGFELNCTTVNNATKLLHRNVEVMKISVQDGKSWLKTWISRQCYNRANNTVEYNSAWTNFTNSPYALSADDNKVIVLGCNSLAYMRSNSYIIGCLSTCDVAPKNGSCSSTAGCCQVDLPRGVRSFEVFFNDLYNNSHPGLMTTPCNYFAVMERAAFEFTTTYLNTTEFWDADDSTTPVVMEWVISQNTCEEAIADNRSYACVSSNSHCITNDAGYLCNCSVGYTGNPYVQGGCIDADWICEDINECELQSCNATCINTPGSFLCQCPPGTYGNPFVKGGCIKSTNSSQGLTIGLVVSCGSFFVLLAFGGPFVARKIKLHKAKKRKQTFFKQNHGLLLQQLISQNVGISERMIISLGELEKATNNFDRAREIGGGGHGVVYKGILDLHVVAIKKPKIVVQREINEFINEVAILSQMNHRNVVKLLGCCLETEVPLLVYEFISNETLSHHLHAEGRASLAWSDRLRIALETARAVAYLHSASSVPVFHRDIKSSNILLDDNLTAKVSDFGASRYIPIDQTGVTTVVQGTFGYLDPMYYYTGRLTDKSDVFSFGVLLVELLTRKKPSLYNSDNGDSLVSHFVSLLTNGGVADIIDPQVKQEGDGEIQEVAALAAMCTKLNGEDRPTMRDVEMTLENLRPKKHAHKSKRPEGDETATQFVSVDGVSNESSRQYTMEEEILLSAWYPR